MAEQSVASELKTTSRLVIDMVGGEDPIDMTQQRVMHALAVCKALALAAESVSTYELDLMSALCGLGDLLHEIHLDLDPKEFRALVLSSQQSAAAAEVANV